MKITRKRFIKTTRNKCRFNGQRKIVQFCQQKTTTFVSIKYLLHIFTKYVIITKKWVYICRFKEWQALQVVFVFSMLSYMAISFIIITRLWYDHIPKWWRHSLKLNHYAWTISDVQLQEYKGRKGIWLDQSLLFIPFSSQTEKNSSAIHKLLQNADVNFNCFNNFNMHAKV